MDLVFGYTETFFAEKIFSPLDATDFFALLSFGEKFFLCYNLVVSVYVATFFVVVRCIIFG